DTLYYYRVTAFNAAGDGAGTTTSRRSLMTAPSNFHATPASTTSITLTWDDSSSELSYKIERWTGKAWAALVTLPAGTTSYTNIALAAGKSYSYRIKATNAGGDSAPSDVASATTPASAPLPKKSAVFQSTKIISG